MERIFKARTLLAAPFVFAVLHGSAANAMAINPNGAGQVLIYPYYTVNKQQQTLLTVTNTTSVGKAIQIAFHEGYNGRIVYLQDTFLGPNQSWTSGVFAKRDAGISDDSVGIATRDRACSQTLTSPATATTDTGLAYRSFDTVNYTGKNNDGASSAISRTREGFIEIIELGEIIGDTQNAITPSLNVDGPDCSAVIPKIAKVSDLKAPGGGLIGDAAIIDVAQGTYFSITPTGIDGFRKQAIAPPNIVDLSKAGDDTATTISASFLVNGSYATATFPKARAIDAVSALLMASELSGNVDITHNTGAATDWILTFPTKHFYVDGHATNIGIQPFEKYFSDEPAGESAVTHSYSAYSRDGFDIYQNWCGFNECPPIYNPIQLETQIVSFTTDLNSKISNVFGSNLSAAIPISRELPGIAKIGFSGTLDESNEGYTLTGLPVIGIQAINYINANVTPGVLSNYSGTAPLHKTVTCTATTHCP